MTDTDTGTEPAHDVDAEYYYRIIGDVPPLTNKKKHPILDDSKYIMTRFNPDIRRRLENPQAAVPFQNPGYIYGKSVVYNAFLKKHQVTVRSVLQRPHAERSQFADPITREFLNHPLFEHMSQIPTSDEYKQWNVASLANSYYAIENLRDHEKRLMYANIVKEYLHYLSGV